LFAKKLVGSKSPFESFSPQSPAALNQLQPMNQTILLLHAGGMLHDINIAAVLAELLCMHCCYLCCISS
jgi:hypothetical protein